MIVSIDRKPEWLQAVFLALGGLLAAGTFWFKEVYEPRVNAATLAIAPHLEVIGRRNDDLLLRASFDVENTTPYRVYVPAFWYVVRGMCFTHRELSPDSFERAFMALKDDRPAGRFTSADTGEIVAVGRPSPSVKTRYGPSARRHYEYLFLVPAGRYSAVRMEARYMVAKDISQVDSTHWGVTREGIFDQVFIADPEPYFRLGSAMRGSRPYADNRNPGWVRAAGVAWGWSHATLSLWPGDGGGQAPRRTTGAAAKPGC